jgi:plasmid replication initiation protein
VCLYCFNNLNIFLEYVDLKLKEMTYLKSTYSKNMFRLLKQYKHTGYFKIQIDLNIFLEYVDLRYVISFNSNLVKSAVISFKTCFNTLLSLN